MRKFKLRSSDPDTLYSIFQHSSLTPLDIKQLNKTNFFYTYTTQRAMERNERVFVRVADTFDCPILFNMAGRNFLYFFKKVNDRDGWE
jgi:hypothetical protein